MRLVYVVGPLQQTHGEAGEVLTSSGAGAEVLACKCDWQGMSAKSTQLQTCMC